MWPRRRRGAGDGGEAVKMAAQAHTETKWPKVAIIVLNWNGWRDTIECLESLQRITYPNYQIIVVDNGSTDDSMDKIKAWARGKIWVDSKFFKYDAHTKPVHYLEYDSQIIAEFSGDPERKAKFESIPYNRKLIFVQTRENLGYAGGNNVGIMYALYNGVDYVLPLNNDTIVNVDFLEAMVTLAEEDPKIGIVGPKVVFYDNPDKIAHGAGFIDWIRGRSISKDVNQPIECDFVTGVCILIKKEILHKLGCVFDEDYFIYWEDTDFCMRVKQSGYKIYYDPIVMVAHKVSQSTGLNERNPFALYYYRRNNILFMQRHAPRNRKIEFYIYIIFVKTFLSLLKSILRYKGFRKYELMAILKSSIDGLTSKSGKTWEV